MHKRSLFILVLSGFLSQCTSKEHSSTSRTPHKDSLQDTTNHKMKTALQHHKQEVIAVIDLLKLHKSGSLEKLPLIQAKPKREPFYKKKGTVFEGYDINSILKLNPKFQEIDRSLYSLRFVCVDGYHTTFPFSSIEGGKGVVAIRMGSSDQVKWPSILRKNTQQTAGPFYLVWDQLTSDKYRPWPYQLTRIELISNVQLAVHLEPPKNINVKEGYQLFQTYCLACHRVNLKGGQMGPELNVPKNILEYRDEAQLIAFVKSPQSFRVGSRMSPTSLNTQQIESVFKYLRAMGAKKICQTLKECALLQGH